MRSVNSFLPCGRKENRRYGHGNSGDNGCGNDSGGIQDSDVDQKCLGVHRKRHKCYPDGKGRVSSAEPQKERVSLSGVTPLWMSGQTLH